MHTLTALDYTLIAGYLIVTLGLGLAMSRIASSSMDHYYLGGRRMPWFLLGMMGMTTWFDLTGTMVITSFLYMLGPRGLFIEFRGGAVLILAFMLVYTGKWHRRSGCMTGAEWGIYRFGNNAVAQTMRVVGATMTVITCIMMTAYLVRGASLFLGIFFPYPPLYTTIALLVVTTSYTVFSGFYGVVLTDLLQGIIIVITCVIVGVMAWNYIPDVGNLAETARLVTGNSEWTSSIPGFHTPMPSGYEAYSPIFWLAAFYLVRHAIGGLGTGGEARYFGARSDRDCGLQSLLQAVLTSLRWPLMISFAVLGIYFVSANFPDRAIIGAATDVIKAHHPAVTAAGWHDLTSDIVNNPAAFSASLVQQLRSLFGEGWQTRLPLVGFHGTVDPEQVLPVVLLNMVPSGLKGLIIVAMLAALMSTQTGMTNGASAYFVKDIYQAFVRPSASNRELMYASYAIVLLITIIGFFFGITAANINELWTWILFSLMAGQLAPGVLRLYWWRCNAWGCVGGSVLGATGAIAQRVIVPEMNDYWQFALTAGLSFAGTIITSLLTQPTPMPVLKSFYRTTRPFGFWGPLRQEITGPDREAMDRENRNDIIAVPFALLWQVTLFLMPMQLVIKAYLAFWCTVPLFLVGAGGMFVFWWRPLMGAAHLADRKNRQAVSA